MRRDDVLPMTTILQQIQCPADLRKLSGGQIGRLAAEIRQCIIETVSHTGGHLAPNLGVVELTIAIHLALDCPRDKVIWDVGHQSYVHKLLTGRCGAFASLRQQGGICGFPRPEESPYDCFATGHSSTSISVALGMARARDLAGDDYTVMAVIGDGSLASGMAFEAVNDAGHANTSLIVILNDNEMSISRSVGGLASYLGSARANPRRRQLRSAMQRAVLRIPIIGRALRAVGHSIKRSVKSLLLRGMLFEELGFMYIGPIDGHNVRAVRRAVDDARQAGGPVLIHVITRKGLGYPPAEANPARFHGTGPFDVRTGEAAPDVRKSFTAHFSDFMVRAGESDEAVVAITAAMTDGTGLRAFSERFPDRFFDVGIAEQHAVAMAAGLAAGGCRPVVAVYSTFLQRAYDQALHDVGIGRLPVVFAIDRAGIVGEDGYTHQGAFDVSFMRHIPGMTVMAPKDEAELYAMMQAALGHPGPSAVRYPRSPGTGVDVRYPAQPVEMGRAEVVRDGRHCAIFALGPMVWPSLEASRILSARGVSCAVVNVRFVKPLDTGILAKYASSTGMIITCEDAALSGGLGSAVLEALAQEGMSGVRAVRLGIPDRFIEHGRRDAVLAQLGLDARGIAAVAMQALSELSDASPSGGGARVSTV